MAENPMIEAYLVYSGCGVGGGDAPITSENVKAYAAADPELARKLKRRIRRLGFRVEGTSPFGVRVCAPQARFEEIFHSAIETNRDPHWARPPVIPHLLRGMVDEVIFPQGVELVGGNQAAVLP